MNLRVLKRPCNHPSLNVHYHNLISIRGLNWKAKACKMLSTAIRAVKSAEHIDLIYVYYSRLDNVPQLWHSWFEAKYTFSVLPSVACRQQTCCEVS